MTRGTFFLSLVLGALLTPIGSSAESPLTVDDVVKRHTLTIGGIENIRAMHSLVVRGVYHEPGEIPAGNPLVPRSYQASMRPYYEVIGDPALKHPNLREGFDGSSWEYYGDPGIVVRTVGAAASASRHASEFLHDSLLDYHEKGTRIELQGAEEIAGRKAYKLHVTLADGFEKLLFVDADNFFIVAERKSAPIHAFGESVTSETRFSDFRPEGGVTIHHRVLEVEMATGKVLNEARLIKTEVNTLNDPGIFSPAPYQRTPLQQFLEQLYMERSDPVSVMYSYRIFRAAYPTLDRRSGVEFVGYQMAKMGDFASAVQLLRANADDYPASASAQYSLGRALKGAGQAEAARAAFRRALQIDPKFQKATAGLNALR